MEPVIVEKKITWLEYKDVGLRATDLREAGADWLKICSKYKEIDVHFYEDHFLAQLVERNGQIQVPAILTYAQIDMYKVGDRVVMLIYHPEAPVLVAVRERHVKGDSLKTLFETVRRGIDNEKALIHAIGMRRTPEHMQSWY